MSSSTIPSNKKPPLMLKILSDILKTNDGVAEINLPWFCSPSTITCCKRILWAFHCEQRSKATLNQFAET